MSTPPIQSSATAGQDVAARAQCLFHEDYDKVLCRTDRLFARLMVFQWFAAIAAALLFSPRAWAGVTSATHLHVWAAIFVGGLISALPVAFAIWRPGQRLTRHMIAVGQMLTSALLIHLLGGRIETHFHVFGSLAFLAFYRDWRVLVSATVVVALDHLLRGVFWPQSVYGVASGAEWRWVEHAGWVVFEDAFLILSCAQSIREMKGIALRQAEIEAKNVALADTTRRAEAAAEAKGQFLANMSHEIRTPLNGVIGTTDLLVHTPLNEKQARYAGLIKSSAATLLSLVNDILDFSKIQAGKFEIDSMDFAPRTLVEEVAELLAPRAAAKGLELLCRIGPDVPAWARGDPGRLRQVLLNLGANGVKFTERGQVVISAYCPSGPGGAVRFSVADTGIGIPEAQMSLLFQKFSQVDGSNTRRHGGTGLGLAISKELTELMGGTIGVDSSPGRGSTFWAEIPMDTAASDGPPSATPEQLAGRRVLIVDDNATNREILSEQCTGWGFDVTVAEDGPSALARIDDPAQKRPFDLALLDMQMPGMTGLELAQRLRAHSRCDSTRLLVLSSIDDLGEDESTGKVFCARLVKPVRQSDLFNTILRLLVPSGSLQPVSDGLVQARRRGPTRGVRLRALLAEDNRVNQVVAVDMLADMDVDCVVAPDGRRALELIQTGGFHFVLMDCQMPEMDGLEATRELRRLEALGPSGPGNPARLPIIALTANALKGDRERCLAAGMDEYVSKPIDWDALATAIANVIPAAGPAQSSGSAPDNEAMPDAIRYPDLLRRCRGKTDTAIAVLEVLIEDLGTRLIELEGAATDRDTAQLAKTAHALKGAAANASAEGVRRLAAEIEEQARAVEWESMAGTLARLRDEIDRCTQNANLIRARIRTSPELGENDAHFSS